MHEVNAGQYHYRKKVDVQENKFSLKQCPCTQNLILKVNISQFNFFYNQKYISMLTLKPIGRRNMF